MSRNLFDDTIRDDIFLERYQKILDAGLANFDVREKLPEGVVRRVACPLDMDVLVAQMSGEFLAHVRMREFYARKERWLDFSMNDGNDVRLVEMMYALLSGNRQAPLSLVENGKMPFSYDNIMVIDTKGCHEMCLDKIYNLNTLYKIFEFPQEKQHIREMSKLA